MTADKKNKEDSKTEIDFIQKPISLSRHINLFGAFAFPLIILVNVYVSTKIEGVFKLSCSVLGFCILELFFLAQIFLLKKKKYRIANFSFLISTPVFLILFPIIWGSVENEYFFWYHYVPVGLSVFPYVLFPKNKDLKWILVMECFYLFLYFLIDKLLISFAQQDVTIISIVNENYFFYKFTGFVIFIFLNAALYYNFSVSRKYESQLLEHHDKLQKNNNTLSLLNKKHLETEKKLNKTLSEQEAIVNSIQAGIVFYKRGRIYKANKTFAELLGYNESDILGKTARFFYPENVSYDKELKYAAEVLKEGRVFFKEVQLKKSDNSITWIRIIGSVFDKNNIDKGSIWIFEDINEQKKIQTELENYRKHLEKVVAERTRTLDQSRERFRALAESAFEAILISEKGVIIDLNSAATAILGYSKKELIGKTEAEILYAPGNESIDLSYLDEISFPIEIVAFRKDKSKFYAEVRIKKVAYQNTINKILVIRDITASRNAKMELVQEKQFVEFLINSLPGIFYLYQNNGERFELVKWNKNYKSLLGYTESEIYKATPEKFLIGSNKQGLLAQLNGLDKVDELTFETELLKKNGEKVPYFLKAASFNRNNKWHFLGIAIDISEQKKTEKELHRYQEQLEELVVKSTKQLRDKTQELEIILKNLGSAVCFIKKSDIIWTNTQFELITQYRTEELVGMPPSAFFPDLYQYKSFIKKSEKSLKKEKKHECIQQIKKNNDSLVWCQMVGTAIDSNDLNKGIIWIINDITKQKQAEQELKDAKLQAEAANRAKSEFLANMSHEIRTPMNAVLGFTELLIERHSQNEELSEYLNRINNAGKSLVRLINDILDLSKIEAGKLDIQNTSINPYFVLSEVVQVFQLKIQRKGLKISIDAPPNYNKFFLLDEVRLRQILFNLIGNAVKFTSYGEINILFYDTINHFDKSYNVFFEIHDTGIGIKPEQQEVIFDAFTQQKNQSVKQFGGTGLGLAITKRLVEMMNGEISVVSKEGEGSVFKVAFLGVASAAGKNIENDSNINIDPLQIDFKGQKVLIIEDDETNREVISGYLGLYDLNLFEAENGKIGIDLAKKIKPDIVLLDIMMPVMNGCETANNLRAIKEFAKTPIIAITASSRKNTVDEGMQCFSSVLLKPLSKINLINTLIQFLPYNLRQETVIVEPTEDTAFSKLLIEIEKEVNNLDSYPDELINIFKGKLNDLFSDLIHTLSVDEVIEFADTLTSCGQEYDNKLLIEYGDLIKKEIGMFNFDESEELIKLFDIFLSKIKSLD